MNTQEKYNVPTRNGAPRFIGQGKEDALLRGRNPIQKYFEQIPAALPSVFLFTQKGDTMPTIVTKESAEELYGAISFDLRSKYATHQTLLATEIYHQEEGIGQPYMLHRLRPDDAKQAYLAISLHVTEVEMPVYQREFDNTFSYDENGDRIPTGQTFIGKQLKWVLDQVDESGFGKRISRLGTYVTSDNDTSMVVDNDDDYVITDRSVQIPFMDLRVADFGAYGDLLGIRMWASDSQLNGAILGADAFNAPSLYYIEIVDASANTAIPATIKSSYGINKVPFTMNPNSTHNGNKRSLYLADVIEDEYGIVGARPVVKPPFDRIHVYQEELDAILSELYETEAENHPEWDGRQGDIYRLNIMSGKDKNGAPYETFFVASAAAGGLSMTEYHTIYASGGSDGDLSSENFDALVRREVANWGDLEYNFRDMGFWPQNTIYDTGFSMATKYAMIVPTERRKDMMVYLSPYELVSQSRFADPTMSDEEEGSICQTLMARSRNTPESVVLGTDQCRVVIIPGAGRLLNTQWRGYATGTLAIAKARAVFMGDISGRWRADRGYDKFPENLIDIFDSRTYAAANMRDYDSAQQNWDRGMTSLIHYDRSRMEFAAVQTVYRGEESPLHSEINVSALAQIERLAYNVWQRLLSGGKLSNSEFLGQSDKLITAACNGRFDNRFEVIPRTVYTSTNASQGYSWETIIVVKAKNGKRVNTMRIVSQQSDDFYPAPTA